MDVKEFKMVTKKGLGDVQLVRPTRSRSALTVVGRAGGGDGPEDLEVSSISTNPLNPQWRQQTEGEDFERLVASVAAVGVLQPLLVASVDSWRREHPAESEQLDEGTEWVALDGNRRLVAARVVGRRTVAAVVRDDLAADDASVMIHANGARAALTPIDEALAYQRLIDSGLTQSKIAQETGVSQPVIAKRLRLLDLPEGFQEGVAAGELPIAEALALLKVDAPAEDLVVAGARYAEALRGGAAREFDNRPDRLVRTASSERRVREGMAQAHAIVEAQPDKFTYFEALDQLPGGPYPQQLTPEQAEKATEPVAVTVSPYSGNVQYFKTAAEPVDADVTGEQAKRQDKARRDATKARAEYTAHLATSTPSASELRTVLARMMIKGQHPDSEVRREAWKIALRAGLAPETEGLSSEERTAARYAFDAEVANTAGPARDAMAWLMVVAYHERSLANTYSNPWRGETAQWYYTQLERVGYAPTEWESDQLNTQEEDQ